jgi:hypothetical protein
MEMDECTVLYECDYKYMELKKKKKKKKKK